MRRREPDDKQRSTWRELQRHWVDRGRREAQAKAEAEALVTAFSEAMDSRLATKSDINRV